MVIAELSNISFSVQKHFWLPRVQVLKDVSLQIEEGEIFGFIGPNGAGKTSSIKALLGLIKTEKGKAKLFGHSPEEPKSRKDVGYMPELAYFQQHLTPRDILKTHAVLSGMQSTKIPDRVEEVLHQVGLQKAANRALHNFSKGMRQRLSLGQAIVGLPKFLILDEPMSGLDPIGRRDVRDLMLELKAAGTTILFSTHILPDIEALADRVGIIVEGQSRASGKLDEILGDAVESVEVSATGLIPTLLSDAPLAPSFSDHDNKQYLWTVADTKTANHVIDWIRKNGGAVDQVRTARRTLEDLFVENFDNQPVDDSNPEAETTK